MAGKILVGSCSWADKTLIDAKWYPPEAKSPEDRLRFYSDQFSIVEVDSTYYAIPLARNGEVWAERTPGDFTFDVKSYALFTLHGAAVKMLPRDIKAELPDELLAKNNVYMKDLPPEIGDELWRRFMEVLLPMDSAGKLGVVLFQFPPWFGPRRENRDYILEAKEKLGQYRMAVEFRNSAWMAETSDQERSLKLLRDNNISYVSVDEPQGFKTSIPPVVAATNSVAVLRMHGHNNDTWTKKVATAAERFDYIYSKEELTAWLPRIEQLADEAREVHVLMNNCHRDYSVRNAREIGEMLDLTRDRSQEEREPEEDAVQERLL
ncbi:MAG: DUF72 domain-containing protein [Chloroflexota bacterium]